MRLPRMFQDVWDCKNLQSQIQRNRIFLPPQQEAQAALLLRTAQTISEVRMRGCEEGLGLIHLLARTAKRCWNYLIRQAKK